MMGPLGKGSEVAGAWETELRYLGQCKKLRFSVFILISTSAFLTIFTVSLKIYIGLNWTCSWSSLITILFGQQYALLSQL